MTLPAVARRTGRIAAWLAVAVALLGFAPRMPDCGPSCCAQAPAHHGAGDMGAHGCCCDHAPVPCDIQRDVGDPVPPAAVAASPAAQGSQAVAVLPPMVGRVPAPGPAPRPERMRIPGTAPPTPLYLQNTSLLC